jgi:hypothetical protein
MRPEHLLPVSEGVEGPTVLDRADTAFVKGRIDATELAQALVAASAAAFSSADEPRNEEPPAASAVETPGQKLFDRALAAARWPRCPERFLASLELYVKHRAKPGHFLVAVLENDLQQAVSRADKDALDALPHIVGVVFNHLPLCAWGSAANVGAWLRGEEDADVG